ncbi:N-formylglutamate amidohydrolase [uncultured Tateyamaria sp.]|uniref:N-formylglutamate amidohydrolase n=1 Tax=Tateyamaria sp. 1078 TaxID=3417464 RepID=UPI002624CDF9|nr:N-formylglutamate amidohydrolase [uncultured Tateyamaria sp.]
MTYEPYFIDGAARQGRWVITCDHATNTVPPHVADGDLGLPDTEMDRHIAYDIGALGVALALGRLLDAPVVASNFSRLVIDPNRGADDPTLIPQLYDGTIIPANRYLDGTERQRRIDRLYDPYHEAIAGQAQAREVIFLAMHSFTPRLKDRPPRPWEVGVLSAQDRRIADPLIAHLGRTLDSPIGDNEPYAGFFPGDSFTRHAHGPGRPNVLLEVRQDLIATEADQSEWAHRIATHLEAARQDANL